MTFGNAFITVFSRWLSIRTRCRTESRPRQRLESRSISLVIFCLLSFACRFDSALLDDRACSPQGTCEIGFVCCRGYCVRPNTCIDASIDLWTVFDQSPKDQILKNDQDHDGIIDAQDNCPTQYNPQQLDGDNDQYGDLCDCAPTDKALHETALELSRFGATTSLTPVEIEQNWKIIEGAYHQTSKNGIQRAQFSQHLYRDLLATLSFRFIEAGDDGLSEPVTNLSLAGLFARTAELDKGKGSGYFCALDLAGNRLVVGKTSNDGLAQGKLTLFPNPQDPAAPPGKMINQGISTSMSYQLTMSAKGKQLICQVLLPTDFIYEITVTDGEFSSGSFALFTAGASAYFQTVKVCVNH